VVIGQTRIDLGRADTARAPLERAIALGPRDPEILDQANQALARVKIASAR
jgi:cytochrome c-type biogenesis protein CcmH/NrfG